ncbi:hypothetical protein EAG21025_18470 [Enterobacter asburiae]
MPCYQQEWESFSLTYQHDESYYEITITRGNGGYQVILDGIELSDDRIPLKQDGQRHIVEITQN